MAALLDRFAIRRYIPCRRQNQPEFTPVGAAGTVAQRGKKDIEKNVAGGRAIPLRKASGAKSAKFSGGIAGRRFAEQRGFPATKPAARFSAKHLA
jgi:hypothetical protein